MRIGDGGFGIFLILAAAGVLWHVRSFPSLPGHFYGPGFFPTIILVCLLACGVMLVARAARATSRGGFTMAAPSWRAAPQGAISVGMLVVAILAFFFLGEAIGFQPIAFATLLTFYLWLGRGVLQSLGLAVAFTVALELLFRELLRVPIPSASFLPI